MESVKYKSKRINLYQEVTNSIIKLLETQKLKWDKPWIRISSDGLQAHNAISGRNYSGLNQILLSIRQIDTGYPYSGWLTYCQIQKVGGRVIIGEKSTRIVYGKVIYFDQKGKMYESDKVQTMNEDELKKHEFQQRIILKYYNVFNVAQSKDLPADFYEIIHLPKVSGAERDYAAESLIKSTDAVIAHKPCNEAYYDCLEDVIYLPERKQFKGKVAYYETTLHELAHWTGHETRLNRSILNMFGTEDYAKEELVAELGSAFLCTDLGFTKNITNNAAYIQNWIRLLKDDHRYIFKAVKDAERATVFIKSRQSNNKE